MRKKLQVTFVASSLLSGTALVAVAAHQISAQVARDQVASAIAHVPGAQAAAIQVNPLTGRVEIDGLSLKNGASSLSIGSLAFSAYRPLPSFIAPAFAADAGASAKNVVLNAGPFKFTIDEIDASGTTLTSADLTDLVNPASPTPIADRLAKLTAASISIPTITENFSASAATGSANVVYKNTQLTNIISGKIASATVDGASIDATGAANEKISGTYGAMTFKNVDLALAARIFTTSSSDASAALQPLYDSATLSSMTFTEQHDNDTAKISLGKMSAHDIKARPLATSFTDIGQLFAGLNGVDEPTPAQVKSLVAFVSDIFSSFEIGGVDASDLSVEATGDQPANVKIGHIGIDGWSGGRIGSISYDGFVVSSGTDVNATIGNFSLQGLNFGSTLKGLQALAAKDSPSVDDIDPRALVPSLDAISFSGLDFDVPDDNHQGNAAGGSRDQFKLGKFEIDLRHYFNGIPTAITTVVDGLSMAIPSSDDFKQLADLGYSAVTVGSKFDLEWNGPAQELSLNEFSANIPGMGSVVFKGKLGNVTQDVFSTDTSTMEAAAIGVLVKSVDLFVQDDGLFNKALAIQAQRSGTTVDQVRSQLVTTAGLGIPAALGNNAAAKAIGAAVSKFIAQPKNLHITASSSDGLGASDMALLDNPGDVLSKLDVTATANQ